jgi:hypothetical protein
MGAMDQESATQAIQRTPSHDAAASCAPARLAALSHAPSRSLRIDGARDVAETRAMQACRGGGFWACVVVGVVGCGHANDIVPVDAATNPEVDAALDAAVDAAIDTPPPDSGVKFDIAYINELTLSPDTAGLKGILLVVNRGVPVNVGTITVASVIDDFPGFDLIFAKDSSSSLKLQAGHAAGALAAPARVQIVDSGLVTEPIDDRTLSFTMAFPVRPPPRLELNVRVVLQLEDKRVTLPLLIHIVDGASVDLTTASRVSSQP